MQCLATSLAPYNSAFGPDLGVRLDVAEDIFEIESLT